MRLKNPLSRKYDIFLSDCSKASIQSTNAILLFTDMHFTLVVDVPDSASPLIASLDLVCMSSSESAFFFLEFCSVGQYKKGG
mmetsp:Transcript_184/g.194  ORF Transcript_184/g.194 Transcript_184/m.194 type:complete len:82 (+) Transcript_184:188-433(+)